MLLSVKTVRNIYPEIKQYQIVPTTDIV